MSDWGRDDTAGRWMPAGPRASVAAIVIAGVTAVAVAQYRYDHWSPAQQFYLKHYVRSTVADRLHLGPQSYTLLTAANGTKTGRYPNAAVRAFLQDALYGESLWHLFAGSLYAGAAVLIALLAVAVPKDVERSRARRLGRRLKGPELVDAQTFTRRLRGDGMAFRQITGPAVAIPRSIENSHILLAGDTGTGKSTLIAEILETVATRGETAVVYDPAMDYVTTFYQPDRGDVILNPVDARCPYWKPGDEVVSDVEALTLATALIPPRDHEGNPFFPESARAVFAFLLTFRPTTQQLVEWLTHEDQLDRLIRGTVHEAILDPAAPAQRSGVRAALNMVADRLQMCPAEHDSSGRRWSAAAWAQARAGWVFLTSSPSTRERLIPLHTLWLDSIILRLMGGPRGRKVWLVVDEVATLNKLPQLHTAVTEGRKYNMAMVLGFQGRAQLETRYGHDADTMLSQPATKIFLHASDAKPAKWASDTIGDVEIERMKQSRQDGWARTATTSYGLERQVEPLVMPSEISGLANLTGYIKVGNMVSRLQFRYVDRAKTQAGIIPRPSVPMRPTPLATPPPLSLQFDVSDRVTTRRE
jgi:type IV secretory pathway TraG/TraD family ATPase VirD4